MWINAIWFWTRDFCACKPKLRVNRVRTKRKWLYKLWKMVTKSWGKNLKNLRQHFCRYALLLLFSENSFCLWRFVKNLNSTERDAFFQHFWISKVITTAHAHRSSVIFHIFPRAFKQQQKKITELRPKMTELASKGGGGGGGPALIISCLSSSRMGVLF